MAGTVIVNSAQKKILALIIATLLLEFGSFTKLKKIWQLAFTGVAQSQGNEPPVSPGPNHSCPVGYTYVASINKCVKFGEVAT